jgi:hypothetical protein
VGYRTASKDNTTNAKACQVPIIEKSAKQQEAKERLHKCVIS